MRRLVSFWLGFGMVATSATQLRIEGVPVGAGELLLAGWVGVVGFLLLRGIPFSAGRIFWLVLGYWTISLVLLAFGAMVGLNTHRLDAKNVTHDAIAFGFLAILSCPMALSLFVEEKNSYPESVARSAFATFSLVGAGLLLVGMIVPNIGPVRLWWGQGTRFLGWADNPNQMALFALGMPFLGWFLLQHASRAWHKVACAIGIGCCLVVGWATLSDALRLSWIVGLGCIAGLAWWRAVAHGRGRYLYVTHLLVPVLTIVVLIGAADEIFNLAWEVGETTYAERGQGDDRILLWTHGLKALLESPLVGFGPGAHSGHAGPFQSFEAHNALIDWGTSTGLLGILLHVLLVIWCARQALRGGSHIMFGLIMALTVFGVFGYTLRQPIYWMFLIFSVMLAQHRTTVQSKLVARPDPYKSGNVRHALSSAGKPRSSGATGRPGLPERAWLAKWRTPGRLVQ